MRIFDSRQQQEMTIDWVQAGRAGLYVCGPTVYNAIHIGNARPEVVFDVLARHLRAMGLDVTYVRNFTDVDDKIIQRAAEEGVSPEEIAKRFTGLFHGVSKGLGCLPPTHEPRATEHIAEMQAHIAGLIGKGHAYESAGDVYFSVRSLATYGQLTRLSLDALAQGDRNETADAKRDPADFALWKAAKLGEPAWASPWGPGRPGWHIECSAMAHQYLGESFDIHGGGIDLRFPHHENELAQSEGLYGAATFARHWMHNGHVGFRWVHEGRVLAEGTKISKSDTQTAHLLVHFLAGSCLARHDGEAIRLWMLGTHYRTPLPFDVELDPAHITDPNAVRYPALEEAEQRVAYGYETMEKLAAYDTSAGSVGNLPEEVTGWFGRFQAALEADLNTPVAVAEWYQALGLANRWLDAKQSGVSASQRAAVLVQLQHDLRAAGRVLGLLEADPGAWLATRRERWLQRKGFRQQDIDERIAQRNAARVRKDFQASDALRAALLQDGIELMDTPQGTRWRVLRG